MPPVKRHKVDEQREKRKKKKINQPFHPHKGSTHIWAAYTKLILDLNIYIHTQNKSENVDKRYLMQRE